MYCICCFKQKTAYDMRISDWSSDVCSSDLTTLLGVVLNVLLAWPDCCFRSETVVHPRTRNTLAFVPAQFNELEVMPKERELIEICKQEKAAGQIGRASCRERVGQ